MARYAYNIVFNKTVVGRYDPHPYSGTPKEFARAMLLNFPALNPELASAFVNVNVWDSDKDEAGNPSLVIGLVMAG